MRPNLNKIFLDTQVNFSQIFLSFDNFCLFVHKGKIYIYIYIYIYSKLHYQHCLFSVKRQADGSLSSTQDILFSCMSTACLSSTVALQTQGQ